MPVFRHYLNKKEGNEHSRLVDITAKNADEAHELLELEDDEVLEQTVRLAPENFVDEAGEVVGA